jgi:hypothetical protein
MIDKKLIVQMKSLNLRFRWFGRAEIKELKHLLQSGEKVLHCVFGFYQGGSGLLVATERRIMLIDKRPFYLHVEDMLYDTLHTAEVGVSILQASLKLDNGSKKISFRSISDARLKDTKNFVVAMMDASSKDMDGSKSRNIARVVLSKTAKPYLNPAWRPRHTILLPRPRPQKFYTPNVH